MSSKGSFLRGFKWYSQRDIEGNLPSEIANDPNKMVDVNFYLSESEKKVEETKPVVKKKTKKSEEKD